MNLNVSSQNKTRPVDTRLRALRRVTIPPSPEVQIEELHAAYNSAVAETHGWVAECESLITALEAERERGTVLSEQLGCARADAERLIEALATAYTLGARKAADAAQRAGELAAAIKELSDLRGVHAELRTRDHELLKRCGDLTSRVASKSALLQERTDELGRALQDSSELRARAQLSEAERNELSAALERSVSERDALKQDCDELREALAKARSAHAQISAELAETTERFLAFVNEAHAERRVEVQTLSQLIDEAQQGRAWGIKRFLRKLWRK